MARACSTAPYDWDIKGKFASGADFHFIPGGDCAIITGEKGKVWISRGGLRTEPESLKNEKIGPEEIHLYQSPAHMTNYLECVKTRQRTVAHVEVAVLSDTITQLSMIAIYAGRKIKWDPTREEIIGDPQASQMMVRSMRRPWHL